MRWLDKEVISLRIPIRFSYWRKRSVMGPLLVLIISLYLIFPQTLKLENDFLVITGSGTSACPKGNWYQTDHDNISFWNENSPTEPKFWTKKLPNVSAEFREISKFSISSLNFHFWAKIAKKVTRVNSSIFTNSPYIWFTNFWTKLATIGMAISRKIA